MNKKFWEFVSSPKKVLWSAAGVGVVMLLLVQFIPVFYRDSVAYMGSVAALWLGNWQMAFNLQCVPLLFVSGSLFMPLGLDENRALSLVSSLLALGMLYPGYKVLSYYLDRTRAAWGSVLFFLAPPVFRVSFAPLTDSARWFFMLLCWMMILSYRETPKMGKALLLGVFFAMLSLVRSEGIVFAGLFSVWFFVELWRSAGWKCGPARLGRCLLPVAAAWIVMLALLVPRLIQLHEATGIYSLDTRQTWAVRGVLARLLPGKIEAAPADPQASYTPRPGQRSKVFFLLNGRWNKRFWKNILTGCFLPYAAFALLGIVLLAYRKKWRSDHTLMMVLFVVNAGAYMAMRSNAGRYFFINTFFFMPFTLYGLESVWEWIRKLPGKWEIRVARLVPPAICAVLAVLVLSGMKNIFNAGKEKYYGRIGRMMGEVSRGRPTRSGTEHPVYLIFGDNYGWGFHCRGNELSYDTLDVPEGASARNILTEGVHSGFCCFAVDPLRGKSVLKPDYVLICREDALPAPLADCGSMLEPIPQDIDSRVTIYRVGPEKTQTGN